MRSKIFIVLSVMFLCLSVYLISQNMYLGLEKFSLKFLFSESLNSGREGGIGPIIMGTFYIWMISILISSIVGIASSIFIFEIQRKHVKLGRFFLGLIFLLAGVPSVVFGLLGNELFVVKLDWGYSLLSGIATISFMMIPLVCLSVFLGLKGIDPALYKSALSLNLSKLTIYKTVLYSKLRPAILTGVVLASGRILAETAALLFTSGYSDKMPDSLMDSSRSLTVHIYDLMANVAGGEKMAYASSLSLFIMIVGLNFLMKKIVFFGEK